MASAVTEDQVRALTTRMVTPTLGLYTTEDLVALACEWDSELRSLPPGSEYAGALAEALLEMHRIVDERLAEDLLAVGTGPTGRGPLGRGGAGSPTAGIAEDIPPFGNVDIWMTYLPEPQRTRRHRPVPPPPPPPPPRPPRVRGRPPVPTGRAQQEGTDLGVAGRLREGTLPGPVSEVIPPGVSTGMEIVINTILEGLEATVGPLIGGLLSAIAMVDAFEAARRTQAEAAKAWGVRLGLMALSYVNPLHQRVETDELLRMIRQDTSLSRQWNSQLVALGSVPVEQLMRESVASVARAYNSAVREVQRDFEAACRERGLTPTDQDRRELWRAVREELVSSARARLPEPRS
jgi:hypothetical protein